MTGSEGHRLLSYCLMPSQPVQLSQGEKGIGKKRERGGGGGLSELGTHSDLLVDSGINLGQ